MRYYQILTPIYICIPDERYRIPQKTSAVKSSVDDFSEYTPSESDSMVLDNVPMRSKNYVLSGQHHVTENES